MIIARFISACAQKLMPVATSTQAAYTHAWWLLQKATALAQSEIIANPRCITKNVIDQVEQWIALMVTEHVPLGYILETVPFLSLELQVRSPILLPRPETEQWTDTLIERLRNCGTENLALLDLCSGTGCIGLSVAHAFPRFTVTISDNDRRACTLMEENRLKYSIINAFVYESDLFNSLPDKQRYSIITANPPYISFSDWQQLDASVQQWESPEALIADDDGLAIIKKIIIEAPDHLTADNLGIGHVWIEIGEDQAERVYQLFKNACYKTIEVYNDQYNKPRVMIGSL